jgi:hypothetical protein
MKKFLLLFIAVFSSFNILGGDCGERYANTFVTDSVLITKDIWYGRSKNSDGSWKDLYLDFYQPYNDSITDRPLLLFMHGGSFLNGDKNMMEAYYPCYEMARRGYTAASLSYRLEANPLNLISPEKMIKAVMRAVQDAKAGIRYFYRIAKDSNNVYGIDTNQIFMGGCSAGAIAAMHTAYMNDLDELEPDFRQYVKQLGGIEGNSGSMGYSSRVIGVVEISGALRDKHYMDDNINMPMVSVHNNTDMSVPSRYGRPYLIPTLPVVCGSIKLHEHALTIGLDNPLYIVPGIGHVPYKSNEDESPVQPIYDSTMTMIANFMHKYVSCYTITTPVRNILTAIPAKIFPNPAKDYINLEIQDLREDLYVYMYNQQGERVHYQQINTWITPISLLNVPTGIYNFVIVDNSYRIKFSASCTVQ